MELSLHDIALAVIAAIMSAMTASILWLLNARKYREEIRLLKAQTDKASAEARDISSEILIRELDRLAQINDDQFATLEQQRVELTALRAKISEYADRERSHAEAETLLREEIRQLRANGVVRVVTETPIKDILKEAFSPPEAARIPNEFDSSEEADGSSAPDNG